MSHVKATTGGTFSGGPLSRCASTHLQQNWWLSIELVPSAREQVAPPKLAIAARLGHTCRRLAKERPEGALCSCVTFLLAGEVCALFQSWNSCLNVTSSVPAFIHDDQCCSFFSHMGSFKGTGWCCSVIFVRFYPHMGESLLLLSTLVDPDTSEESWLLEQPPESVGATGDRSSVRLQAALKRGSVDMFSVKLLVETHY